MNGDVLRFFERHMEALPLYEAFEEKLFAALGAVNMRVQKTQIAFSNRRNFAFVSFLPVRAAKERPAGYLVVSFGLADRVGSPRVDAAAQPCPNRWTHHVMISRAEEIDGELMGWIREAADFADQKR